MKKIINSLAAFILVALSVSSKAQNAIFLSQGRIEFERKLNLYARIDSYEWMTADTKESVKKNMQQFKTTYFDLRFNGNKTLYQPGRESDAPTRGFFGGDPADNNIVLSNLATQQSVAEKHVFEQTFLVQDSTRKIQWKITNETRNIAGFECRRANAIILDSIYVVAFYTDAITTTGGPESFNGLPGMILGIALPHEHVTWFATKVFTETIPENTLVAPTKGKKVTSKEMLASLQNNLSDWGNEGRTYIKETAW
ncbi:MAG TPA: GLPGLI family protein [Chitinophagaceae bacterium]|nr:GLPGLI family protein [Chitinophagaceae bacterium]